MCSSHLGARDQGVQLGMKPLLSRSGVAIRQQVGVRTQDQSVAEEDGAPWAGRPSQQRLRKPTKQRSPDQRWTLAVERPLRNEKLHGNGAHRARQAQLLIALMRQFQSGSVDVDTEAGSFTRDLVDSRSAAPTAEPAQSHLPIAVMEPGAVLQRHHLSLAMIMPTSQR